MSASDSSARGSLFSPSREVYVEERKMVSFTVDVEAMIAAYPKVWAEFLADYEEDGDKARRDYIVDFIHEVGLDDFTENGFVAVTDVDADLDVDVKS